jgi:hypothetical protein
MTLRAITIATALGAGVATTPTVFAQLSALGAGLATTPMMFAQLPKSPADPSSPGALVIPHSDKEYRERTPGKREKTDSATRDRTRSSGASTDARGYDSTSTPARSPTSPRAPRSRDFQPKE